MKRIIELTYVAKKDLQYFKKAGDKHTLKRIRNLINAILKDPKIGIGKP